MAHLGPGGQKEVRLTDVTGCPHVVFHPVPMNRVRLGEGFWLNRLVQLQEVTLPTQYERLKETGRLDNFRYASGALKTSDGLQWLAPDSDVYKWLEALSWSLAFRPSSHLIAMANEVTDLIVGAQDSDGYLYTLFSHDRKRERWTNLRDMHELYCAGHLFQCAVAHHRVTGRDILLTVAQRLADHINGVFGPGKKQEPDGHPEVEMALVELYRETGRNAYFSLARFLLDQRGKGLLGGSPNIQDHLPFRQLREMTGHAVRALYLNCGAADIYAHTGEPDLWDTLDRLWANMTRGKMYVTGGLGARHEGEVFGRDYELPSQTAYAETCAAVAGIMWAWRMMLLSGGVGYADVLERILYNGALSGISLDARHYFYVNPLSDRGRHRRQPFFATACCPPNIARLISMVPGMLYGYSDRAVWVHFFATSQMELPTEVGWIRWKQDARYPWTGRVHLVYDGDEDVAFAVRIRIPVWSQQPVLCVNDKAYSSPEPGTYAEIKREWKKGDTVSLTFNMEPMLLVSHPWVEATAGKLAIQRGPIVYCLEQADHLDADVWDIHLAPDATLSESRGVGVLDGLVTLKGTGWVRSRREKESLTALYESAASARERMEPVPITAIPYFAWANRQPGPMSVWIPTKP